MERWPLAAPDQPADRRRRDRCKAGDDGLSDGVQLAVRHGVRLVPDEDQQELERLRCETDVNPVPPHQAGAGVTTIALAFCKVSRIIREGLD